MKWALTLQSLYPGKMCWSLRCSCTQILIGRQYFKAQKATWASIEIFSAVAGWPKSVFKNCFEINVCSWDLFQSAFWRLWARWIIIHGLINHRWWLINLFGWKWYSWIWSVLSRGTMGNGEHYKLPRVPWLKKDKIKWSSRHCEVYLTILGQMQCVS